MKKQPYTRFLLMLFASAVAMYITMYLNTYSWDHVYFSWTRMYMTLIGTSVMSLIMFGFMKGMYANRQKNLSLVLGSLLLGVMATVLVRTQQPIDDIRWMKAMIPHHSIAILTSNEATITDPEVKRLSESILETQRKEIEEMKGYIKRLEQQH